MTGTAFALNIQKGRDYNNINCIATARQIKGRAIDSKTDTFTGNS